MRNKYSNIVINDNGIVITFRKEEYSLTESGRNWKKNADNVSTENINADFYNNYVSSIPFFNNFGGKASCRAYFGYTYAGYIPVIVNTISYDGKKKIRAVFTFSLKK